MSPLPDKDQTHAAERLLENAFQGSLWMDDMNDLLGLERPGGNEATQRELFAEARRAAALNEPTMKGNTQ